MSMYEDEYFFIRKPKDDDRLPSLKPDSDTMARNYDVEPLHVGQAPLRFHNAWREENLAKGIQSIAPEILFDGTNLVVGNKTRERLIDYDFPNLQIYPAIYIDDKTRWQEDRWFLRFEREFDCWDRKTSEYDQEGPPVRLGGLEYHLVYKFVFDQELLDKTPLEQRLLFKLGGTIHPYIVAHQSVLLKVFGQDIKNGAEYMKVSDY